jgi:hypothetical protein
MYTKSLDTGVINLLHDWLAQRVDKEALDWLDDKQEQISSGDNVKVFFTTFSKVPRYTGKRNLDLTAQDLQAACKLRKNWFPSHWNVEQVARTLLVLALPSDDSQKYLQILEQLFIAADVGELVALYQALPLSPYPEKLKKRAAEGVRSNMTAVFNAIALQNPYPSEYFDNLPWNQMVLKALFVGSSLNLIHGLDDRMNPELKRMLSDYADERMAASRSVPSELWRMVGERERG